MGDPAVLLTFHCCFCSVSLQSGGPHVGRGPDYTLHYMLCGFFFFFSLPVTLHLWRDRAMESEGSLVIIILLLLHLSPDGPHLSITPPSTPPHPPSLLLLSHLLLHFHISLSSSVPPRQLIWSLGGTDKSRGTRTDREGREGGRREREREMTGVR